MQLTTGARLGPYQIVSALGAGGMGEVYRARDTRLGREVAVKILRGEYGGDASRLARFEREARAAGALNHPNVLALYDLGTHEGTPYLVTELLEGESLRARLGHGPFPQRKAVEVAVQIARGLAAAHDQGVVHRDLKPENVFLTKDGRVKILDFGLAKLTQREAALGEESEQLTVSLHSEVGVVLGTVGYMAPEQVRGLPAQSAADLFALGAILYEMLCGDRAFRGESSAEVMSAILREDPPELRSRRTDLSPALERIVQGCLEKNPSERFQSARDLALALEAMSGTTGPSGGVPALPAPLLRRRWLALAGAAALVAVALAGGSFLVGKRAGTRPLPTFERLTFRRGLVNSARFVADGQTVLYTAAWEGGDSEIFAGRIGSAEARPLDLQAVRLAVSRTGEIAFIKMEAGRFVLWRVPLAGGAPRAVAENVPWADWSPDGKELAVVRWAEEGQRIEFPVGKLLYETATGDLMFPRVSPRGDRVAFCDFKKRWIGGCSLVVVDRSGNQATGLPEWQAVTGLAWAPGGEEIWFSGIVEHGATAELYAASLSGRVRPLFGEGGDLGLEDVSTEGRLLVRHGKERAGVLVRLPGEETQRDLSWFDYSVLHDLSADGRLVVLSEGAEAAGEEGGIYLRPTDGSPAVRLGDGQPGELSPDGKWVIAITSEAPTDVLLLPTGAGEPRRLTHAGMRYSGAGKWFPDGRRIVVSGTRGEEAMRSYVLPIDGGEPRPITPPGIWARAVSADGRYVAARDEAGGSTRIVLFPVDGGEPRELPGVCCWPLNWSVDGRFLFVAKTLHRSVQFFRIDLANGGSPELWRELAPADLAGVSSLNNPHMTVDGEGFAYSYWRDLNDLYLVEGLR